ncbi:MAG: sulfurtransferase TusA family protein [Dehalococcoidia bacterium]|nr:sulfurtransferase TusA family protein [Dehalococcoidia bacterium]
MTEEVKVDEELCLKGDVCPYTFVKSKLALEEMETGQVLKVVVDHIPAVDNVPRSLAAEGHEVLDVSKVNATDWQIVVRKA